MIITLAGGLFVSLAAAAKIAFEFAMASFVAQGIKTAVVAGVANPGLGVEVLAKTVELAHAIQFASDVGKTVISHNKAKDQKSNATELTKSAFFNEQQSHPRLGA
jgi:hypothetical protein